MQILGPQLRVPLEHFPVHVSCYHRHSRDVVTSFKEAGGCFMAQVVKAQVYNAAGLCSAREDRAEGLRFIRKDTIVSARLGSNYIPSLAKERNGLVPLLLGVLPITYNDCFLVEVDVYPLDAGDF